MANDLDDRGQALENEYFHRKEKEILAKMKERFQQDEALRLGINCPKCEGTLIEADFEGIKIDSCDQCSGVWLDAGELAQIISKEDDTGWFGKLFK